MRIESKSNKFYFGYIENSHLASAVKSKGRRVMTPGIGYVGVEPHFLITNTNQGLTTITALQLSYPSRQITTTDPDRTVHSNTRWRLCSTKVIGQPTSTPFARRNLWHDFSEGRTSHTISIIGPLANYR